MCWRTGIQGVWYSLSINLWQLWVTTILFIWLYTNLCLPWRTSTEGWSVYWDRSMWWAYAIMNKFEKQHQCKKSRFWCKVGLFIRGWVSLIAIMVVIIPKLLSIMIVMVLLSFSSRLCLPCIGAFIKLKIIGCIQPCTYARKFFKFIFGNISKHKLTFA